MTTFLSPKLWFQEVRFPDSYSDVLIHMYPLNVLNPLWVGRWAVGGWGSISRGSPQVAYLPGAALPVRGSWASCSLQNGQQRALWEHVQGSRERSDSEPEGIFILQTQTIILQLSKQTPRQETWLSQGHPASARRPEVTLHRSAFSALLWSCQHRISWPPVGAAAFSRQTPFAKPLTAPSLLPMHQRKDLDFGSRAKHITPFWFHNDLWGSILLFLIIATNCWELPECQILCITEFTLNPGMLCRFDFSVSSGSPFLIITPLKEISP